MAPEAARIDALAQALIDAWDGAHTLAPITSADPSFDVTSAYQVLHQIETRRLQHDAERNALQAQQDLRKKENERALAEEGAKVETLNAETAAAVAVTKAKADAETAMMMAKVHAAEKKAESTVVTPLMVMMHAYDALAQMGGDGTHIMLGDWSKVPQWLFPPNMAAQLAAFSRK